MRTVTLLLVAALAATFSFGDEDPRAITIRLNLMSVMRTHGLYECSFNNEHGQKPPADFWIRSGYWIVGTGGNQSRHGDHHVAQTAVSATYALLQQRLDVAGDFRAQVSIAVDEGSLESAAGFFFHYLDGRFSWIELNKKENEIAAYTWDGTKETRLAVVDLQLWKRDWQRLGVSVHEGTALVRVDKAVVLAVSLPAGRDIGYFGLITRMDTKARFDDLEVRFDKQTAPKAAR